MKKILKSIFILTLAFAGLTSCEDKLELGAQGQIDQDLAYQSVSDLQLGLNGAYANFRPENDITFNSIFADNCKPGFDNGGQQINRYNWALDATDGTTESIWTGNYYMVNEVNRILQAAQNITPSAAEQEAYNAILGQCYALRAHAHLNLLSYFTTDYEDDNALSVFLLDFVPGVGDLLPRSTNGEIYTFIESNLDSAESLIPASQTDKNYVTLDYVTGMRARMAMLRGNNTDAITHAQTLIDAYPLATQAQYINMFLDTDQTEVIMQLNRAPGDLVGGIWYFTNSAGPFMEASNSLHDAFDPADIRLGVNVNFGTANGGPSDPANNIHLINKYPGAGSPFLNNIKIMRVSEMYLIKAEAQARSNDLAGAAATLKELRDARFGFGTAVDVYGSSMAAVQAVLAERRLELAYEGWRYRDIKRLRNITNTGIVRDALDCAEGGNCNLDVNDHRFTLPIPQDEINAQPSLTQNPGY